MRWFNVEALDPTKKYFIYANRKSLVTKESHMLRTEFIEELDKIQSNYEDFKRPYPNDEEYKAIEYVYIYHPTIDNVYGKRQIAGIYYFGGMGAILDMIDKASQAEDYEDEIKECYAKLEEAKTTLERFKYETCHNIPLFCKQ